MKTRIAILSLLFLCAASGWAGEPKAAVPGFLVAQTARGPRIFRVIKAPPVSAFRFVLKLPRLLKGARAIPEAMFPDPQGKVLTPIFFGGAAGGAPAGTAPTFGTANGCSTGGSTCNGSGTLNVTAGDTVGCVIIYSHDGTGGCTNSVSDTYVCTADTPTAQTSFGTCFDLTSTGGATVTTTCTESSTTDWLSCTFFTIHCSATCVIEQAANYGIATCMSTDCTGTTVTTAYQMNELIIGGWGTSRINANTYTTNGSWTVPSGGSSNNGGARGSSGVSYKAVTSTGSVAAKVTIDLSVPHAATLAFR